MQSQSAIDRVPRILAGLGMLAIDVVPVFGQAPRQVAQAADPIAQIKIAEKDHGLGRGAALQPGQVIEPDCVEPGGEMPLDRFGAADQIGRGGMDRLG